jgi:hypothetical protein
MLSQVTHFQLLQDLGSYVFVGVLLVVVRYVEIAIVAHHHRGLRHARREFMRLSPLICIKLIYLSMILR